MAPVSWPAPTPPSCWPGWDAFEDLLLADAGDVPAALRGLLRDLVQAARDLAGPAWLAAAGDDPDIAAFTALHAAPVPPAPAGLDEIISRMLWARFGPPGAARRPPSSYLRGSVACGTGAARLPS